MILATFIKIILSIVFILQCSCGFILYKPNFDIQNISLQNIHSDPGSYVSNSITQELWGNNIDFSPNSSYILKLVQEKFYTDIISTNSDSIIRELKLSLLVKYNLINENNEIILSGSFTEYTILTLDNINVHNDSNRREPAKIKLSNAIAQKIIQSISMKLSPKNENLL